MELNSRLTNRILIIGLLFSASVLSGCQSRTEALVEVRRERTELLKAHRASFDSSELGKQIQDGLDEVKKGSPESEKELVGLATGFVKGLVKATEDEFFDDNCIRLGMGHDVELLDKRSKEFFAKPENIAICQEIYLMGVRIECIEKDDSFLAPFKC
jgi:hypothetical protein